MFRKILAFYLAAALAVPAFGQAKITVGSINKTVFADQYKTGSTTGGIAEAYASCPSTGCNVVLGADIVISTPSTITVADNKPLTINFAGRKITAANASGVGLTFTQHDINTRTRLTLKDGALACSWTNSSLTGFLFTAMTEVYLDKIDLTNCDHSGIGMLWDDVEDGHWGGGSVRFNSLGFQAQNATNQNSFYNVHFDSNVNAVLLKDVGGITFKDCLVQSNTGQHAFSATTTAGNNATELRIEGCHFENNGDGTAASRNLYIAPFAGQAYLNVQIVGNTFSRGAFAPGSNAIEIAGSQNVQPLLTQFNQYNGYGTTAVITGEVLARHVIIGDNGGTGNADAMLGMPNANGDTGIMFNPNGASHCYNIFAGHPSDFQGFLQFWDCTTNASIMDYNAPNSTWEFPQNVTITKAKSLFGTDNSGLLQWFIDASTGIVSSYHGFVDGSNYERMFSGYSTGDATFKISTTKLGTGLDRDLIIGTSGAATLTFETTGALRWQVSPTGHLDPAAANTYDIGAARAVRLINGKNITAQGKLVGSFQNPAPSGTYTFDLDTMNVFQVLLNANVTSTAFTNGSRGQLVTFILCQDGSGAHTWAWGAAFHGADVIGATASKCNVQQFVLDTSGTTLQAVAAMKINQ